MSEKLLYEEIYEKTQDCGRTQFVELLQQNQIKIKQLQEENKNLKEQLKIKHNGFMASVEECCEYSTILDKLERWLEKRIKEETWDEWHDGLCECLDKLQELKEGNK